MIHGKEDIVVPPNESVKKTGEYFKNFEIWDNHAHMIPIEDIQKYADAIRRFVDES
jgi:pimeloyl-ACP methyl ester carboxylesterase